VIGDIRKQAIRSAESLAGLIVITLFFVIMSPTFRQWGTLTDILEQSMELMILAAGTTLVLISGGLDLSVGSVMALCTCIVGCLLSGATGEPVTGVTLAVVLTLGAGMGIGLINGVAIKYTGVPAFIVTLGMMMIARGLALMLAGGRNMSDFSNGFLALGGRFGYAIPLLITASVILGIGFLLAMTRFGFNAYAIGGNEEVARLSGVPVKRYSIACYAIGGFCAALAAIVQTSRFEFAKPNRGESWELMAIGAVVIGGTSLFGGSGGVGRTVIGVLIIKSLQTGLSHMGVGSYWQRILIGVVIILAVWIDRIQNRRRKT
jgi:ribose/xylose/arabinose/galactoside ABC-type transport system permease subunit